MKKIVSFVAIATFAVVSCTKTDVDIAPGHSSIMSIPIMVENEGIDNSDADAETKSYLSDNGSTWSFVWEDEDQLGYFQYRNGRLYDQYVAVVDKRPNSVTVDYPMDNISSNDVLYAYLVQDQSVTTADPEALEVSIPSIQYTALDTEVYSFQENYSFSLKSIRLDASSASKSLSKNESAVGKAPTARTLSFTIANYNPGLRYCVGDAGSNLVVRADGRATAKVTFPAVTEDDLVSSSSSLKNTYKSTANVTVFVEGHADQAANIPVTVTTAETLPSASILISLKSVKYTYSVPTTASATIIVDNVEFSDVKSIPVRDAMPIVSKQFYVNSTYIAHPEDIQSNMTMYMLGSLIEFRVFSTDDNIGVGETLSLVEFVSEGQNCAGVGTYNVLSEDLTATDFDEDTIYSVDYDGQLIANGKSNYVSIYMVVAPGTYPATVNFYTDENVYTVEMSAKTFSRAVRKALNVNLATAPAYVTPLVDVVGDSEEE